MATDETMDEGSGKAHGKNIEVSEWAGRWSDFYTKQRYPVTYPVRLYIKKWKRKFS